MAASAEVQAVFWNWEVHPAVPEEVPLHSVQLIVGSDLVYPRYYSEHALAQVIQSLPGHLPILLLLCDRQMPEDASETSPPVRIGTVQDLYIGYCPHSLTGA